MLVTPRAYYVGLGQVPAPAPAPPPPTEGLSLKGLFGMAALGAIAGAAYDYSRLAGAPEAKDLAPAAGIGALLGAGAAAAWHFGTKKVGTFAASVATPPAAVTSTAPAATA
jgi:hypothetical protein